MKVKTSELEGVALDYAVCVCELVSDGIEYLVLENFITLHSGGFDNYSSNWAQGGSIIEREGITIQYYETEWEASVSGGSWFIFKAPLTAAMRCYVASKLGNEIEIPEELMK